MNPEKCYCTSESEYIFVENMFSVPFNSIMLKSELEAINTKKKWTLFLIICFVIILCDIQN